MIGAKLTAIQVPFLFKHAIDALAASAEPSTAAGAGTAMALLALAPPTTLLLYGVTRAMSDGMTQLRNALFARVAEDALRRMARETFMHLHTLELRFHLERQTGALTRVVERGTRAVGTLLSTSVLQVLPLAFEVSVVSALLARNCGGQFAAVTLCTLALYSTYTIVVTQARSKVRRAQNEADQRASQLFTDSMLNYETVQYFGATAHEVRRYDAALAQYEAAAIRTQTTLAGLNFGQQAIFSLGLGVSMMLAAQEVAAGRMSVGDVVMVQGLVFQLTLPLSILGMVYNQDVHFAYHEDGERPLLRGVSFVVEGGQTVAIVGGSGSGKSSILRLLYRFYDPQAGRITIDGQDIRASDLESVRGCLSVIPQDVVLFNETVRYNLQYGSPHASEAEVVAAAKRARIHEAILAMPDGYDTLVGERGLKLSGGEKQRVAIGRALLRDAPILLCDEATSAMDTRTESEIFAGLRSDRDAEGAGAPRRQTRLMIAHRLSTVVDADLILVLREGRVVEQGSHAELVARKGEYAALWNMQQPWYEKQ